MFTYGIALYQDNVCEDRGFITKLSVSAAELIPQQYRWLRRGKHSSEEDA